MKSRKPGSTATKRVCDDGSSRGRTPPAGGLTVAALAFIRRLAKEGRNRAYYLAGTVLALSVTGISGYSLVDGDPREGRSVGGIDLQGYCTSFAFEGFAEAGKSVTCHSKINLKLACIHEYKNAKTFTLQDAKNAKTGLCRDRDGTVLGGIQDMSGYCRTLHRPVLDAAGDSRIDAEPVDQVWQCRMPLDVSAVCAGQHNDSNLKADRNGEKWDCYRP